MFPTAKIAQSLGGFCEDKAHSRIQADLGPAGAQRPQQEFGSGEVGSYSRFGYGLRKELGPRCMEFVTIGL